MSRDSAPYIGRLAPTPTGPLHLGHARTFRAAWQRARDAGGLLLLRIDDLDPDRCKPQHISRVLDDLRFLGLDWDGDPVFQSQRRPLYLDTWRRLRNAGLIYPCSRSRRELRDMVRAPHEDEENADPIYPQAWRPPPGAEMAHDSPAGFNWRFRVPDGEHITFTDAHHGTLSFTAGVDFGDFGVWRRDDVPAYELAVVADDIDLRVTEVVRGEDLLLSTARQILLYRALHAHTPHWRHEPHLRDQHGRRLAKRHPGYEVRPPMPP